MDFWKIWDLRGTSRIVEMNTELAFDKHKKVVLPVAFRFVTPRTIAGC
jgi:hypothetical protein